MNLTNGNVKKESLDMLDFNQILSSNRGRDRRYYEPKDGECLSDRMYIWTDRKENKHLLFKEDITNRARHYVLDLHTGKQDNTLEVNVAEAMRRFFKIARQYKWAVDYPNNKEFADKYHYYMYSDYDKNYAGKPIKAWQYDMNSCYPAMYLKPLPYGEIIKNKGYVADDELGFEPTINNKGNEYLELIMPGEYVDKGYIFKAKVQKAAEKWTRETYELVHNAVGEERAKGKILYNAVNGCMKRHNIFIGSAILGYAKRYIISLRDENTIMQTVDSIVSLQPRNDLDIGFNLGQFKVEHENEDFIYYSESKKQWSNKLLTKGIKKTRLDENNQLIPLRYYYNIEEHQILEYPTELIKENKDLFKEFYTNEENQIR